MSESWKRWQDWATVVVGVLLFISPFVLAGSSSVAWIGYVGGVLLVIAGLWSLSSPTQQIPEYAEVVIGVLLFIAPWVFGFAAATSFAYAAWVAGILAVILSGWVLLEDRGRQSLAAGTR